MDDWDKNGLPRRYLHAVGKLLWMGKGRRVEMDGSMLSGERRSECSFSEKTEIENRLKLR